jgi:hypothetical protein
MVLAPVRILIGFHQLKLQVESKYKIATNFLL